MENTKISSPQGTHPAHAARTRAAAQTQTQAPDANDVTAGGFLALLASLGDVAQGEGAVVDLGAAAAAELVPTDPATESVSLAPGGDVAGVDTAALVAWQGLLAPGASLQGAPAAATEGVQAGAVSLGGMLPGVGGPRQGMVAETAVLDTAAEMKDGVAPASVTPRGRVFSRVQSTLAQKADSAEAPLGRLHGSAAMLPSQAHQGAALAAAPAGNDRVATGLPAGGAPERSAGGAGEPSSGAIAATMVESLFASVASARGRSASEEGGRSGEGRSEGAVGFDGGGISAPAESGATDSATVFADPAQAGSEEQVAEQVAYWVNQKTQNAELTLTRDGQPVEVSVSLSGNEAHVSFRSDQPHTRELLDQSMAQLSELLRSEGLVLSGMSVGTSAGQGEASAGSERQGRRDGARHAQVVAAAPAGVPAPLRGASLNRAVDVFV